MMETIFWCIVCIFITWKVAIHHAKWYYTEGGYLYDLTPEEIQRMRKVKK